MERIEGDTESFYVTYGRLLFRSPELLGTRAREVGVSCDACHTNGGANTSFFISGISDRPGNVDASHRFWNRRADDGRHNPVNIPSLRGVRWSSPYGRDGRIVSLRDFTRMVIVTEFAGPEPDALTLDALTAYLNALALPAPAGAADRPGAALFRRDCAGCHIPSAGYLDRLSHDVGSGGRFDTPTLLGTAETAPYYHDGRFGDLSAVLTHYETRRGTWYAPDDRQALLAYLNDIGAPPIERGPISLRRDLDRVTFGLDLLNSALNDEADDLFRRIAGLLRQEIGRIHGRYPLPGHEEARGVLAGWARQLRDMAANLENTGLKMTREAVSDLRRTVAVGRAVLTESQAGSHYATRGSKKP